MASDDPAVFQEFQEALGTRDPKTIVTYLTTMRDFVTWLAAQPGGTPFHLGLLTETAVRGYMDSLKLAGRRSKALSGLRRFCQWAMDEGYLRRNPARAMERPTVVAMAPTELSEKQRFVLKQLVELRRRVQVGLNKGEARNALARAVFFYRHGRVQDRSHAQQQRRAQGLNLVVAAIILWNTLELARAVEELQQEGMTITAEQLAHLSPILIR